MPAETRCMRSDQDTVNGLTAYKLGTSNTLSFTEKELAGVSAGYIGIRVWKRDSGGSETEITSGVCVAVASVPQNTPSLVNGSWNCPETPLALTDSIVVRVYACAVGGGSGILFATFTTEQLGATQLDSATWTVYYYCVRIYDPELKKWFTCFFWGDSSHNSKIENFTWVPAGAPPPAVAQPLGDGLTWIISVLQTFYKQLAWCYRHG